MSNHAVVKPGKMISTNVDSFLISVQNTVDMDNGAHVVIGAAVTGNPDLFTATAPTAVDNQEVFLVESPIINMIDGLYRIGIVNPRQFYNIANYPARARKLITGDIVSFTADAFSSAPTIDQYAVPVNGSYKLAPAADLSGNTLVAYKVLSNEVFSIGQTRLTGYKLQVVKSV